MRADDRFVADFRAGFDDRVRLNRNLRADFRIGRNDRGRMNARRKLNRRGRES